jgi:putative copper export protein
VLLFLGLITTRIVSSHGAASLIFPTFTFIDHAIHLISKSLWVGGVVMIALLPFLIRKKEDDNGYKEGKRENEKDILISLSKIIALAIGVAGITGAYILWLDLKDFSLLITSAATPDQCIFDGKGGQWQGKSIFLFT